MVKFHIIALLLLLLNGCALDHGASAGNADTCTELTFEAEQRTQLNPVTILETGAYFLEDNIPVSRACARSRLCQVNEFVRENFGQSYYLSLNSVGGKMIAEFFPEVVDQTREGRGAEQMIYLNNFCIAAEEVSATGASAR